MVSAGAGNSVVPRLVVEFDTAMVQAEWDGRVTDANSLMRRRVWFFV